MSEQPNVEQFRIEAMQWMADNLARRDPNQKRAARGLDHKTVEGIAHERAVQRRLYDAGFAGITWPTEFGGRGLSDAHQRAFDEEAEHYQLPDLGICGVVTRVVCANVMLAHATDDFNRRHLPRIAAGDELWAEFFSEPSAGSDLAGITTRAVRDGDHWILNGAKIWSSGAYYADYGICLARTDWDVPKHRGLTWFAVPTNAPGVTVRPLMEITGDVEFCEELFVDVVIPDSERIGDVNDGWTVAQTALLWEREASSGSLTAASAPTSPGPLAPDLVRLAQRAGRAHDAHARQLIARSHTHDFALTQLGARVAQHMDLHGPAGAAYIGYIKLAAGTFEPIRARAAMELGGGAAITWPAGDLDGITTSLNYLNSRVTAIAGGTNEMQRNGIGERILGLPREPATDRDKSFNELLQMQPPPPAG
ncbi:MAG: acyl-CoA dehydrogenase protein [Acidimicrobiia bacterium]|nr:acyl-CoA dehydrogenase protein [Acidimicrobiia bacterium]